MTSSSASFEAGTWRGSRPAGLLYLNLTLGAMILWWAWMRVLHQLRPRWSRR